MYLSARHRFLFIAIPRTASRSLVRFFQVHCGARPVGGHHDVVVPPGGWERWQVVTVCRHPYSWMVSKFRSLPARFRQRHPAAAGTFERFIDEGLRRQMTGTELEGPYFPQSFWLERGHHIPAENLTIVRFESLPEGLTALPFVGAAPRLPRIGATPGDYRDLYTEPIRQKVAFFCRGDFERFGYDANVL